MIIRHILAQGYETNEKVNQFCRLTVVIDRLLVVKSHLQWLRKLSQPHLIVNI